MNLEPISFSPFQVTGSWGIIRGRQIQRLRYARKLKIPHLHQLLPCEGTAAIIGAAPSVVNYVDKIKQIRAQELGLVWSINGAHEWLIKQGIVPNMHVLFETDMTRVQDCIGGEPHRDVYYYLCSHCQQSLFKSLHGYHRVLWHCWNDPPEYQKLISHWFPGEFMVGGGYVTLFRSINIAIILGYRKFEIFGCDSSYEGDTHVPGYHNKPYEQELEVWVGESADDTGLKLFKTLPTLAYNAYEFMRFCEVNQSGLQIRVHGDGLLPTLHKAKYQEQYEGD